MHHRGTQESHFDVIYMGSILPLSRATYTQTYRIAYYSPAWPVGPGWRKSDTQNRVVHHEQLDPYMNTIILTHCHLPIRLPSSLSRSFCFVSSSLVFIPLVMMMMMRMMMMIKIMRKMQLMMMILKGRCHGIFFLAEGFSWTIRMDV